MASPNLTRADANAWVEALNARGLCACGFLRAYVRMGIPGPFLDCEVHSACEHRGLFANGPVTVDGVEQTQHCYTCDRDIPRREL